MKTFAIVYCVFCMIALAIIIFKLFSKEDFGLWRYENPPPAPSKGILKCVCNNIANHTPGGRCEACYKKGSVPRMRNPPMPPAISAESMRLSLENSRKAQMAYKKMIAELKDFDFPNFPSDKPSP
ncbi:MAG: hypothetical protein K2Y30_01945 [Flavobacteriaceae bacterium]|nr:hypothetical protein [Flavobacteriaceae bacterium]